MIFHQASLSHSLALFQRSLWYDRAARYGESFTDSLDVHLPGCRSLFVVWVAGEGYVLAEVMGKRHPTTCLFSSFLPGVMLFLADPQQVAWASPPPFTVDEYFLMTELNQLNA